MVLYLTSRDAPVGEINSHGIYVNWTFVVIWGHIADTRYSKDSDIETENTGFRCPRNPDSSLKPIELGRTGHQTSFLWGRKIIW